MRKKSIGFIFLVIIVGALIGSALGEVLGSILPDGVVKDFFIRSAVFGLQPTTLNLVIFTLTFGFMIKLNIVGVLGVILAAYFLKWVD